jgi:hypothetical protein
MWKSQFSINKIGHILIPHRHRKPRFIAWVKVFLSYLVNIKEELYHYWDETILDASMTPQVMYLERMLNLIFERDDITITDQDRNLGPWVYRTGETPPLPLYMEFGHDPTIAGEDDWVYSNDNAVWVDFTVNIPPVLMAETARIAAIVHKYKLPGKVFIIQKNNG